MVRMIHLAATESHFPFSATFTQELEKIGEFNLIRHAGNLSTADRLSLLRKSDIALTAWGSAPIPAELVEDPGNLKYICNITGSMQDWIPQAIVEAGIPVTNWGDAPANLIAEGAMTLLLSSLKDLHAVIQHVRGGRWQVDDRQFVGGTLKGLKVGVYGLGVIGRRFVELIRPFGPFLRIYDPYVSQLPEGCLRVHSLEELFEQSEAIVIHAGLTAQTRQSVTAHLLRLLPDRAIVVNTARGDIIDQDALFAEVHTGRLR